MRTVKRNLATRSLTRTGRTRMSCEEYQSANEDNQELAQPKVNDSFLDNSDAFKDDSSVCSDQSFEIEVPAKEIDKKLPESSDHRFRILFSELFDIYDRKIVEVEGLKTKADGLEEKLKEKESSNQPAPLWALCSACASVQKHFRQNQSHLSEEQIQRNSLETLANQLSGSEKDVLLERIDILVRRNAYLNDQNRCLNVENTTLKQQLEDSQGVINAVLDSSAVKIVAPAISIPTSSQLTEDSNKQLNQESSQECDLLNALKQEIAELKSTVSNLTQRNEECSETINELWGTICDEKIRTANMEKEHELAVTEAAQLKEEKAVMEIQLSLLLVDDEPETIQTIQPSQARQTTQLIQKPDVEEKRDNNGTLTLTRTAAQWNWPNQGESSVSSAPNSQLSWPDPNNSNDQLTKWSQEQVVKDVKIEANTEGDKTEKHLDQGPSNKKTFVSQHGFKFELIWKDLSLTNGSFDLPKCLSSLTSTEKADINDEHVESTLIQINSLLSNQSKGEKPQSKDENPQSSGMFNVTADKDDMTAISRQVDAFFARLKSPETVEKTVEVVENDDNLSAPANEEFEDAIEPPANEEFEDGSSNDGSSSDGSSSDGNSSDGNSSDYEDGDDNSVQASKSIDPSQNDETSSVRVEFDNASVRSGFSVEASEIREAVDTLCIHLDHLFPATESKPETVSKEDVLGSEHSASPDSSECIDQTQPSELSINSDENASGHQAVDGVGARNPRLSRASSNASWDRISDLSDADLKEF